MQIINEIIRVPVKKEVHPQMIEKEQFGECPVEVPKLQIIDEIVQVPIKKEVHPQMTQKENLLILVEVPHIETLMK